MKENYCPLPELIPEALLQRVREVGPALLCDGMKALGILRDGCMDAGVMPVKDDERLMIGTACTVDTEEGDNFPVHAALYQGKPGYILIIAGKGYPERPYLGDLIASTAQAVGLNGIVVDGYVRDRAGLRALDIPVYAKGIMQRGPAKKGPGRINTTVSCAGVTVCPGDLVIGDQDGVTVVPRARIEEALAAAETKAAYEARRRETIAAYAQARQDGEPLPELAPDWVTELLKNNK